jgi:hypothetical protein
LNITNILGRYPPTGPRELVKNAIHDSKGNTLVSSVVLFKITGYTSRNKFAQHPPPQLEWIKHLSINNNDALETVDDVARAVGLLEVVNNGCETAASFPHLEKLRGGTTWGSESSFENFISLSLPRLRTVTRHPTTSYGYLTIDDNLFQKAVKGACRCDGNHTRPAEPRRPNTATDAPQLHALEGGGEGGGMSVGVKAKISIGVAVGALAILGVGGLLLWKPGRQSRSATDTAEAPPRGSAKLRLDGTTIAAPTATYTFFADVQELSIVKSASPGEELDSKTGLGQDLDAGMPQR